MKKFIIPSVFTAVDKVSAPVRMMGKSVSDFANRSEDAIARSNRRFRKLGNSAQDVAVKSAVIGTAIAAPLGLAAKAAIDFEDKMADVAKVAGVELGSAQFKELSTQALALSSTLAISGEEAAGLMANLAQGGVGVKDLQEISLIAGKVGVAFGVSADLAGDAFIKTQNALGGTIESTEKLMDSINYLGNTTAASSANLLTFMASGGSAVARAAGASGESVAGMGAQLISMGKSAEESATIMERFIKNTLKSSELSSVFKQAGGGAQGMLAVIEKGSKLSGSAQDAYFQQFGEYGLSLQLLGKNFDQLQDKVMGATDATLTANSVNAEFANRSNTTAFRIAKMRSQLTALAIKVGEAVIPIITKLVERISPVINRITDWMSRNRELVSTAVKVGVVLAGLAFTISAVAGVVAVFSKGVLIVNAVTKAWTVAQGFLNAVLLANPIGLVIAAIAALVAAILWVSSNTTGWAKTWQSALDWMSANIDLWYYGVKTIFLGIQHAFLSMVDEIVLAWKWGQNKIGLLSDEQYAKDKARIEAESKMRVAAIQEAVDKASDAANKVAQGVDFQVRMNSDDKPAINQRQAEADSQTEKLIRGQMNSSLTVGLAPGLSGVSSSPNVNIKTSSTKR